MKQIIWILALVFTLGLSLSAMAYAADSQPFGFIAISESRMPWAKAKAYCEKKGGKLPLIGGSTKRSDVPDGTSIDGFGTVEGSWPKGLGSDCYWTGTAHSDDPSSAWVACDNGGGSVSSVYFHARREDNGVVCVP